MSQAERRFFVPEFAETRIDGESGELVGFASVFHDPTASEGTQFVLFDDRESGGFRMVERINPRAFNRAVKTERQRVVGLFNHNADNVLGSFPGTMKLEVLPRGLFYKIAPSERTIFKDVADMVRTGDVQGSSFAFIVRKEKRYAEGDTEIREILDLDLFDVGPTPYPAYKGTSSQMRYAGDSDLAELRARFAPPAIDQVNADQLRPIAPKWKAIQRSETIVKHGIPIK